MVDYVGRLFTQSSDPAVTDDSSKAFKVGDVIYATGNGHLWQCLSTAVGAASWKRVSTNLTETEEGYLDGVTLGTVTASKLVSVDASKQVDTWKVAAQTVNPAADNGAGSTINAGVTNVNVGAVVNDTNDWITLPSLADVPVGHTINIACNAGGAFELRTPATSGEKINTVDCDGSNEYLCTDTELIKVTKVSDADGWVATALTALGAVATAVVPD